MLQREIPDFVNLVAAKTAKAAGTTVILDVGGRDEPFDPELFNYIDIISPNETELERVINHKFHHSAQEVKDEIHKFIK